MYEFEIIPCSDGSEIIDRRVKTPYSSLTPTQMTEYQEVNVELAISDYLKRKAEREEKLKIRREKNPLYKLACILGEVRKVVFDSKCC